MFLSYEHAKGTLTPMRTRNKNTISLVANSMNHILNRISSASRKHNVLWPHDMNRPEVRVEESS
jgi:hypothetical protein